jgi:hypothetical protein
MYTIPEFKYSSKSLGSQSWHRNHFKNELYNMCYFSCILSSNENNSACARAHTHTHTHTHTHMVSLVGLICSRDVLCLKPVTAQNHHQPLMCNKEPNVMIVDLIGYGYSMLLDENPLRRRHTWSWPECSALAKNLTHDFLVNTSLKYSHNKTSYFYAMVYINNILLMNTCKCHSKWIKSWLCERKTPSYIFQKSSNNIAARNYQL